MRLRIVLLVLFLIVATLYLLNASWLTAGVSGRPVLLAHRGVHQTFHREGLTADSCTATMIHPPMHDFIENTLPSMRAAFEAGADVVELDIHPTRDGHFAVFHDWTLDCRTDSKGVTREHTLAELKALDVGYGYTADGSKTFPLRGKGVGLMPSLDEVLAAFPGKGLLIHIKSNDPTEGEKLAARLAQLPEELRNPIAVYGGNRPIEALRQRLPGMLTMSKQQEIRCLVQYLALSWSGYVPFSCSRNLLLVPQNYAWLLWGWPDRFLSRMGSVGAVTVLAGPYEAGDFSTGIDTVDELKRAPQRFSLGIWTNRIESIAAAAR
jgi:glycerophosphoryl diester phosphodiesterase